MPFDGLDKVLGTLNTQLLDEVVLESLEGTADRVVAELRRAAPHGRTGELAAGWHVATDPPSVEARNDVGHAPFVPYDDSGAIRELAAGGGRLAAAVQQHLTGS